VKKWMEEVKEHAEPDIVIMLVGNKLDICEKTPSERKVSNERAEDFAKENNLLFMETSAYTDINVRDVFEMLVQEIYNVKSREDLVARNQGGRKLVHQDPSLEEKKMCGCF
jgi:Rab family protein